MSSDEDSNLSDVGLYDDLDNFERTEDMDQNDDLNNVERTSLETNLYEDLEVEGTSQNEERWTSPVADINDESNISTFDLYSELITDEHMQAQASYEELQKQHACVTEKLSETETEIKRLVTDNTCLANKNLCMQKNISSLFLTAKAEIQRKDREIGELRSNGDYWKNRAVKARRSRDIYRTQLQTKQNSSIGVLSPAKDKTEYDGLSTTNNSKLNDATEVDRSVSNSNTMGKRYAVQSSCSETPSRNFEKNRQSTYSQYFESKDINRKRKMETDQNDTRKKPRVEKRCLANEDSFHKSEEMWKGSKLGRTETHHSDRNMQKDHGVRYHSSVDASLSQSEKQKSNAHDAARKILEKSLKGLRQRADDKHCYSKGDSRNYDKYLSRKTSKEHAEICVDSREIKHNDRDHRNPVSKRNPCTKQKMTNFDRNPCTKQKMTNFDNYAHHSSARRSVNRILSESSSGYSRKSSSLDVNLTEYSADEKYKKDSQKMSLSEKYIKKNRISTAEKDHRRKEDINKRCEHQSSKNFSETVSDRSNNYSRKRKHHTENTKESHAEMIEVLQDHNEPLSNDSDTDPSTTDTLKKIDCVDLKPLPCDMMMDKMPSSRRNKALTRIGESVGISSPGVSSTDIVGNTMSSPSQKMTRSTNEVKSDTDALISCNTSQSEDSDKHVVQLSKTTKALQKGVLVETASELVVNAVKVDKGFGKHVHSSKTCKSIPKNSKAEEQSKSDKVNRHNVSKMITKYDSPDTKNVEFIDNMTQNNRNKCEEENQKVKKRTRKSSLESVYLHKKERVKEKSPDYSMSSARLSHTEKRYKSPPDTFVSMRHIKIGSSSKHRNSFEKSKTHAEKLHSRKLHSVCATSKISRKYEEKQCQNITDLGLLGDDLSHKSPKLSEKQVQSELSLGTTRVGDRSKDIDRKSHRHSTKEGSRSENQLSHSNRAKYSNSISKDNKHRRKDKERSSKSKLKLPKKITFQSEEGSLLEDPMIELLPDDYLSSKPDPSSLVGNSSQFDVNLSMGFGSEVVKKIISNPHGSELPNSLQTMSTEHLQIEKEKLKSDSFADICDTKTATMQKENSSLKRAKDGEFLDEIEKGFSLIDSRGSDMGTHNFPVLNLNNGSADCDRFSFKDMFKKVESVKHDKKHQSGTTHPAKDSLNRKTTSVKFEVHSKQGNININKKRKQLKVEKSEKPNTPDINKDSEQTSETTLSDDAKMATRNKADTVTTDLQMSCSGNISSASFLVSKTELKHSDKDSVIAFQKVNQKSSKNEASFKLMKNIGEAKKEPQTDITETRDSITKSSKVEKLHSDGVDVRMSDSSEELKSSNLINSKSDSDGTDNAGSDISIGGASKSIEVDLETQHSLNQPALYLSPCNALDADLLLSSDSDTDSDEESGIVGEESEDEPKVHTTANHADVDDEKHERELEVEMKNDTAAFENKDDKVNASMPQKDNKTDEQLFRATNDDDLEEGEICDSEDEQSVQEPPKTIDSTKKDSAKHGKNYEKNNSQQKYIIPKHNDLREKLIRRKSQEIFREKARNQKQIPHNLRDHSVERKENKYPAGKLASIKKCRVERNQRDLSDRRRQDGRSIRDTDHDKLRSDSIDCDRSRLESRDRDRSSLDTKDYGRSRLDSNSYGRSRLDSGDCGRSRIDSKECSRSRLDLRVVKSKVERKRSRTGEKSHSQSRHDDYSQSRQQSRDFKRIESRSREHS